MMLKYQNKIPVAAHRGNAKYFPENTMASFRAAAALRPDMIETDVHMTKDGALVLLHDHMLGRTTDGTGLIREKTLRQIRMLDAGRWKGAEFEGERVPVLEEFLDFFKNDSGMLFNIELKDYPADSGSFAYEAAEKTVQMMKEYGIFERSVINSWSGELNEYLWEKYRGDIRIHAYSPQEVMGLRQKRFVYDYAYCVCLWGTSEDPVADQSRFALCRDYGAEPWVYFPQDSSEIYDRALERGAALFTSNDPAWAMEYLRGRGLHR